MVMEEESYQNYGQILMLALLFYHFVHFTFEPIIYSRLLPCEDAGHLLRLHDQQVQLLLVWCWLVQQSSFSHSVLDHGMDIRSQAGSRWTE